MTQGLFYKSKDGKLYSCDIVIQDLRDVKIAIFRFKDLNAPLEELQKFVVCMQKPLGVNAAFVSHPSLEEGNFNK